jgi:tetratricopeptide (TPR) repeat protein
MVVEFDGADPGKTCWMNMQFPLTFIFCLLLGGCSQIKYQPHHPRLTDNPLASAKELAVEERWGEAEALLAYAIAEGWDSDLYQNALQQTTELRMAHERKLRDQLLTEQTTTLQKQLPILNKLERSDPNDQVLRQAITNIRQDLKQKRKALSDCGRQHKDQASSLARQCLELALSLEANTHDQLLLDQLTDKKIQTTQDEVRKQQDIRVQQWKSQLQERLRTAEALYQKGQLNKSRKQLERLLAEDPSNDKAKELLVRLRAELKVHLDRLLEAGDRLYREGEIEGAKALWQAALKLDPRDSRIIEKLERVDRVLENIETLRKTN